MNTDGSEQGAPLIARLMFFGIVFVDSGETGRATAQVFEPLGPSAVVALAMTVLGKRRVDGNQGSIHRRLCKHVGTQSS